MARYAVLALVALLWATAAACSEGGQPAEVAPTSGPSPIPTLLPPTPAPAPSPTPTPEPTPSPEPRLTSAGEIVEASVAAMAAVDSLHFDMDMTMKANIQGMALDVPMSFEGDYQAPDRFHGTMSLSLGIISLDLEFINIGAISYTKDPETGEWTVVMGDAGLFASPSDFIAAEAGFLEAIELVGEETLEGVGVYLLNGLVPIETFGESGGEFDASYWIGIEGLYLRKVAGAGEIVMSESDPLFGGLAGAGDVEFTMTFSAFGEPVSIEAPDVDPEAVKVAGIQAAIDGMMAEQGIGGVTASTSSTDSWTDNPTGAGAAPLREYLPIKTTMYFYCWDAGGQITRQDESSAGC